MALAMMMRCGLEVDAEKFRATHDFVARGTNDIGYVWYKDGGRQNKSYADMGRTGAAAWPGRLCAQLRQRRTRAGRGKPEPRRRTTVLR